ncbi:MAG: nucleotide kinase domain-containing protein [Pseudonocardiaceae bacterium]
MSECFDICWRFTAERQRVFHARASGAPPPWTTDPVIAHHKFTNVYACRRR